MVGRIAQALLRRRVGASRWPYILTALPAFLFVGHAYEDAGWPSALIYLGIIAISVTTAIWPNVLCWLILFAIFVAYGTMVLFSMRNGPQDEWVIFVSLGYVPAAVLYLFRPSKNDGFLGAQISVREEEG